MSARTTVSGFLRNSMLAAVFGAAFTQADSPAGMDQRVEALLARKTLEEKAGQLCQYVGIEHLKEGMKLKGKVPSNDDAVGMYPKLTFGKIEQMVRDGEIGSFLHVVTVEETNRLQSIARESRLQIPPIIGIDVIHGNAMVRGVTVYPAPLGLAATFDEGHVEKLSRETTLETRANGAQWTFTPNVDVARDVRWGRCGQTFGEDPHLVGRLGAAMVRGLQGPDAGDFEVIVGELKQRFKAL